MTRADEYRTEFNKLEKLLRKMAGVNEYVELISVIKQLVNVKKDRVIVNFQQDLREYLELRNAIVHQSTGRSIAEPYPETIKALQTLRETIEKPKTAWNVATKELFTATTADLIQEIVEFMAKHNITNVPVLDDGIINGFISEKTILKFVANNIRHDGIATEIVTVSDLDTDQVFGDDTDIYKYVAKSVSIYEVQDLFEESIEQGKRLMAIIVTDSGSHRQKPLGIITSWDMYR